MSTASSERSLVPVIEALGRGNAEGETNFESVFVQTADYRAAAATSRMLFIGARGSGKSAIFLRMADNPEGTEDAVVLTVPLAADRISWPALEQAAKASNNDVIALSRQWELTLLLLVFNKLLESQREIRPKQLDAKRKRLVRDLDAEVSKVLERSELNLASEGMLSDVFGAAATILRKLPFTFKVSAPFVPVSLELKDSGETTDGTQRWQGEKAQTIVIDGMYGVVEAMLSASQSAPASGSEGSGPLSGRSVKVQILADQLDDFWTGTPQQIASLCGLITAAMRISSVLLRRGLSAHLRFILFLRSDLYEVLKHSGQLTDHVKYRRDEQHLKWDEAALRRLVDRRLEVAGAEGVHVLDDLFANERLERRPLVDYFLDRLVPRPRDVIVFLAECLEAANLCGDRQISAESLRAGEDEYSGWRLDVFLQEAGFGALRSPRDVVDALRSGPRMYTQQELTGRLVEAKKEYGITETKPQIILALVEWGVLGIQRSDGRKTFIWNLRHGNKFSLGSSDEDNESFYVVHPSLWTALDLKGPAKRRTRRERAGSSD